MKHILLLGHKGMLGHMVNKYLKSKKYIITTTEYRWPDETFKQTIKNFKGDFIINCIGSIHQKYNDFDINWELPIFLEKNSNCRIIHPGTDCEMDNDPYGSSKRMASYFIETFSEKTKSLKTSIIGPELNSNFSLMEWVLSHNETSEIFGYSKFMWNGNTTLTWAEKCEDLMENWENFKRITIISSECISKFDILTSINKVFDKNIKILPKDDIIKNKCLIGDIKTPHILNQIKHLKEFYYD